MSEKISVSFPELMSLAVTRGMIGFGAGLLVSNLISRKTRKEIGIPLLAFGLLTTIPIARSIFHEDPPAPKNDERVT
ncbi:MAG TPA: hypothetical protein VJV05_09310 [Pyrinomonadaceae bacterium]|nr:hypothetical protein [Pyrinomonadaceae bacterium]